MRWIERIILVSSVVIGIVGCAPWQLSPQLPVQPTPILTPILSSATISQDTVSNVSMLVSFTDHTNEAIAATAFTPDGKELLTVTSPSGVLSRWDLIDSELISEFAVGPARLGAVTFDASTTKVATVASLVQVPIGDYPLRASPDELTGVRVWNTVSGQLLFDSDKDLSFRLPQTDAVISDDGEWIGFTTGGGLTIVDVVKDRGSFSEVLDYRRPDNSVIKITALVFDPSGDYLFFANDYDRVQTAIVPQKRFPEVEHVLNIEGIPLDIAVDPQRRYLATVTTSAFTVQTFQWMLPYVPYLMDLSTQFNTPLNNTLSANVEFSHDGKLVVVTTEDRWQIWSMPGGALLTEHTPGGYATAFSPDGRLLAIGGTDGTIQVWGVAEN